MPGAGGTLCAVCKAGTYSLGGAAAKLNCTPCDLGYTTLSAGATTNLACSGDDAAVVDAVATAVHVRTAVCLPRFPATTAHSTLAQNYASDTHPTRSLRRRFWWPQLPPLHCGVLCSCRQRHPPKGQLRSLPHQLYHRHRGRHWRRQLRRWAGYPRVLCGWAVVDSNNGSVTSPTAPWQGSTDRAAATLQQRRSWESAVSAAELLAGRCSICTTDETAPTNAFAVCRPGFGGVPNTKRCDMCKAGYYSPGGTKDASRPACVQCQRNTWTAGPGATKVDDCKPSSEGRLRATTEGREAYTGREDARAVQGGSRPARHRCVHTDVDAAQRGPERRPQRRFNAPRAPQCRPAPPAQAARTARRAARARGRPPAKRTSSLGPNAAGAPRATRPCCLARPLQQTAQVCAFFRRVRAL